MIVNWIKNSQNNSWFDFLRLNIESSYFDNKYGIYVIWYTHPTASKVVKIGSGNIGMRLKEERVNPDILKYSQLGQLKVTWTIISQGENLWNSILAYLSDKYTPLIGERFPAVPRQEVNLIT